MSKMPNTFDQYILITVSIVNKPYPCHPYMFLTVSFSDSKLFFEVHINKLCKNQKLKALPRVVPYLRLEKRKTVMKAFATSQFGYCPLVSTFHSRGLNYKINSWHERALRITDGDKLSSFQELLKNDNSVSIHHRNIQAPVTEMFKVNCTGNYERTFCS